MPEESFGPISSHEAKLLAEITALKEERDALRDALLPFSSPPAYVFDEPSFFVPSNRPEHWIGGGWFHTDDFRKARAALDKTGGE